MPFLEVPPSYFRKMVNALGGRYNYELDLYSVDCKQIDSLPPITITLYSLEDRLTYSVQPHDFVGKIVSLLIGSLIFLEFCPLRQQIREILACRRFSPIASDELPIRGFLYTAGQNVSSTFFSKVLPLRCVDEC